MFIVAWIPVFVNPGREEKGGIFLLPAKRAHHAGGRAGPQPGPPAGKHTALMCAARE